jgi:hypothetical protein
VISFNTDPMQPAHKGYSAFDGDVHTYQVVAWVPSAADSPTSTNPDPIDPSSLVWTVDEGFLSKDAFTDIDSAILLTTRREGTKPVGYTFKSDLLTTAPMPDCIFEAFHTWPIDDDGKKGLVWKLRSITPRSY